MTIDPGSSSGDVTPDGCPVDLYAHIPPLGEAALLHDRLASGATVLDLGCGTGRIAGPLARLGHPVVAVDESPAMLARVPVTPRIRPVRGTIQDLRLEERFDAVLLASNMINTQVVRLRQAMLATCGRHLKPGGLVFAQWCPPGWFRAGSATGTLGNIAVTRDVSELPQDLFRVVARYVHRDVSWRHDYIARRLTHACLESALDDAGLVLREWIGDEETWFTAGRR